MYKIPATTLFLGKNLIFMPECHSTNDAMLLLCQKESTPEGTLIITDNQTAGRGQRGNKWEAEPGLNLTFTALVKPSFLPVQKQFYLNILVSLGIRDYLTATSDRKVQIKWPNDVLMDGKKICGILIDNQLIGTMITNSAIGVGLNVNQQQFETQTATSLILATGKSTLLHDALTSLLHCIEVRYLQLKSGKFDALLGDYLRNLFLFETPSLFSDTNGSFTGKIMGIDPVGRLLIEKQDSHVVSYDLKEIRYLAGVV